MATNQTIVKALARVVMEEALAVVIIIKESTATLHLPTEVNSSRADQDRKDFKIIRDLRTTKRVRAEADTINGVANAAAIREIRDISATTRSSHSDTSLPDPISSQMPVNRLIMVDLTVASKL